MKISLLVLLLTGPAARAATYYLAANGDDGRTAAQAQDPATPWRSLAKLNASLDLLQAGDQVLLHRGDTFRGPLLITRSGSSGAPLTFGAYGPAADPAPVVSGSAPLAGWASVGPNLWEAPCPGGGPAVTGVYAVGGRALPLGRYPNRGYLTVASHVANTALTGPPLPGSWVGATAVVRSERWVLDRVPVTGQSGATLALGPAEGNSGYHARDGWGFFLQNHPAALDLPGEWCYDAAKQKIRLYALARPADGAVEATTAAPAAVVVRNQQYLVLENLTLARALAHNLDAVSVSHVTLRGLTLRDAGENGLRLAGTGTDVLLENNLVRDCNNNGLALSGYTDLTVRNNALRGNGLVPGRGRGADGQYFACGVGGCDRVRLEGNTVDSCGYVGIAFGQTNNLTIARNVVANFCLTKDDGGGIYTHNGDQASFANIQILDNVVLDGGWAPEGTDLPTYPSSHGIYLDDCSQNITAAGNTVSGCRGSGIYLHAANHITLSGNTCFGNGRQLLLAPQPPGGPCLFSALDIRDNVLVSAALDDNSPNGGVARYQTAGNDLATMGTFAGNYYLRPFDDYYTVSTAHYTAPTGPNTGAYVGRARTLAEWQAAFGQDAGAHTSPVRFRPFRVDGRGATGLLPNGQFATAANGWGSYSSGGNGALAWDNANRLGSGGSLRLGFSGSSGQDGQILTAEARFGALAQARHYSVRFRAACASGSKVVAVYVKRGAGDFADLTARAHVLLTPTAADYEVALAPLLDDPTANFAFTVEEDDNTEWFDNVDLREATLTAASVTDSIRFEYNATASPRAVGLPAGARYVDARGVAYGGSLTLAPYASVVLLRTKSGAAALASAAAKTAGEALLWPNPTAGAATLDLRGLPAGSYQLTLLDATGRVLRQLTRPAGHTHLLELGALPRGVYWLRGQGPGGAFGQRVVRE